MDKKTIYSLTMTEIDTLNVTRPAIVDTGGESTGK